MDANTTFQAYTSTPQKTLFKLSKLLIPLGRSLLVQLYLVSGPEPISCDQRQSHIIQIRLPMKIGEKGVGGTSSQKAG